MKLPEQIFRNHGLKENHDTVPELHHLESMNRVQLDP